MRALEARVFLIALATLAVEVALERILSVALTGGLSWLVLSAGIFAYGLAGLFLAARDKAAPDRPWLVGLVVSLLAFRPIANSLSLRIRETSALTAFFNYSLLIAAIGLIFFFSSLFLIDSFSRRPSCFARLYGFDLVGAALGVVVGFALIGPFNPGQVLNLMAALGLCVAISELHGPRVKLGLSVLAVGVVGFTLLLPQQNFEFKTHLFKFSAQNVRSLGPPEFVHWDPVSKIEVFPPLNGIRTVLYDGGSTQTSIYQFDGNISALRARLSERMGEFWSPGALAAHLLKENSGARVFLVGVAGGQELKAALVMGAQDIDAAEIVGTVLNLGLEKYRAVNGELFHDSRVHVHHREGRAFLNAHPEKVYDVIQLFSVLGSSAFGSHSPMKQEHTVTVEAFKDYFRKLAPGGLLQLNHVNSQRQLVTLARAWREMGLTELRSHVVLIEDKTLPDVIPTLLVKRELWTTEEIAKLSSLFEIKNLSSDRFEFLNNPLVPASGFFPEDIFGGSMTPLLEAMPYDVSPATDDRPFFQYLRKTVWTSPSSTVTVLETPEIRRELNGPWAIGVLGLALALFVAFCVGAIFLLPRLRGGNFSSPVPWVFFACTGFGFIIVEQNVIHRLGKVLGSAPVAFAIGLFSILLSAGIGSFTSSRLLGASGKRALSSLLLLVLVCGICQLGIDQFQNFAMALEPNVARIVSAVALFPLGFLLGLPFSIGIGSWTRNSNVERTAVSLAWAQNGIFTVVGSYFGCLAALRFGFAFEAWLAVAAYLLAAVAFAFSSTMPSRAR